MLKIAYRAADLDFGQLCRVYRESIQSSGIQDYPHSSSEEQRFLAEQDFYSFLRCFLKEEAAFYGVWESNGRYMAALRMEPYRDGFLLEGLETDPDVRRKGYASQLLRAVLSSLEGKGKTFVYSHVFKKNQPSVLLHNACGLHKYLDYAVFVDGSVSHDAWTFCYSTE
jgi:GNAT superfamily N-acetyltransferase